jgi:hypothetical protein
MGGSLLIQSNFWKLLMGFFGGFKKNSCKNSLTPNVHWLTLALGDVGNEMHAKIIGTNESTPTQV